jgi:hypothetical protein
MVSPAFLVNASISPQWRPRILQEKAALFGLVTAPKDWRSDSNFALRSFQANGFH